ncbi:MAG: hypothetical protein WCT52_02715 [Candidatus Micrarchaeia archaeon]
MAGEGDKGPQRIKTMHVGNPDVLTTLQHMFGKNNDASKGVLKEMNKTAELLIINMGEITKKLRDRKERQNGFALLKSAFEKVISADGAKLTGARCEFDEKNLALIVIVEEKEFVKVSADFKSVYILQDGVKRDIGNFELPLAREFGALLNSLAEKNGVKVEIAGAGAQPQRLEARA